jgi:hypothetical protein
VKVINVLALPRVALNKGSTIGPAVAETQIEAEVVRKWQEFVVAWPLLFS